MRRYICYDANESFSFNGESDNGLLITPPSQTLQTIGLFKHDSTGRELLVQVDVDSEQLSATLAGPDVEAFGQGQAMLMRPTPLTTTLTATVALGGYELPTDGIRQLEAAISAAWILDRSDRTSLELAGTALVTDFDNDSLARFRAVRFHPSNQLDPRFAAPLPASNATGGTPIVDLRELGDAAPGAAKASNVGKADSTGRSGAGRWWNVATRNRRDPRRQ